MNQKIKMNLIISIIVTTITNLLIIPLKASTYKKTFYGRDNIINVLKNKSCKLCYNYDINYLFLVFQIIFVFIICFILLNLFDKRRNNNG